ncbi:MAG: hypothetical protein KDD52_08620 [Bdellovibrionales bacterium]|nr:hypothetical protein [Bdellovibrionales bacterium]
MSSIPKRRKKVIDVATQSKIATETFVQILLFLALVAFIIYIQPFVTIFSKFAAVHHQQLVEELLSINLSKWPLFLLIFVFMAVLNVLYSHKIVGPIYKLGMVIKSYTGRDLRQRMTLRKNDYFKEIIPLVNGLRDVWIEDLSALAKDVQEMKAQNPSQELSQKLDHMEAIIQQYEIQAADLSKADQQDN